MKTNNIFRLGLLLLACFLATHLFSAPATQEMFTHRQSDGSLLNLFLRGDENFHFQETTDGYKLLANEQGDLYYANLASSEWLAHNPEDRTAAENAFLKNINQTEVRRLASQQRASSPKRSIRKAANAPAALEGQMNVLVLLVQYDDVKFNGSNVQTSFSNQLNQEGYAVDGNSGSVRDYFWDNSLNKFSASFKVLPPVTLSQKRMYYGANNHNGEDARAGTMVAEALKLANTSFDFSKYDENNDGYIDFLMVIYAGHTEEQSRDANQIWSHSWNLTVAANAEGFTNPVVDGLRGFNYFCTSELNGASGTRRAGIGTMCHEFAHVLTLHDMYDKDYEENGQAPGFGSWSLMGTGNQLNDGRTPPNLTAFERQQLGWGTVTELKTADTYSLRDISTGDIYRINTPLANEYFLLENRQLSGWDEYLPGSGMLITRVYADEDLFNNNEVNNVEGRERVNLLEANGVYWYSGYRSASSDAFPGSAGITEFNDVLKDPVRLSNLPGSFQGTAANSLLWNGQALGKPIVNIREIGGEIWFDFFEAQNPYSIYSAGNTLVIDSKINLKQILVYNPLGQLIRNIPGQRGENTLELATGQVYILKLNDEVRKIVM